jgi:hypothetical protein
MSHRTTRHLLSLAVFATLAAGCKPSSETATTDAFRKASAERVKMSGAIVDSSRNEAVAATVAAAYAADADASGIAAESENARAGVMLTAGRASSAQAVFTIEMLRSAAFDLAARASRVAEATFEINAKSAGTPERALPTISATTAQARGDAGSTMFPVEGSQLPSLEAVKQTISRLEGEAVAITRQRDELVGRRVVHGSSATAAQQQASQLPLQQREPLVIEAARASKEAALVARNLSDVQTRLTRVNEELEIQRRIRASIETGVADLTEFARRLPEDWREMDQKIAALRQHRTQLVSGGGTTPSLGDAAAVVESAMARTDAAVALASSQLELAIEGFGRATSVAQEMLSDFGSKATDPAYPARDAVKLVVDHINASTYDFSAALARRELARLHANAALGYASVRDAVNAASAAGATLPASISPATVISKLTEHVTQADTILAELVGEFDSLGAGTRDESLQQAIASSKVDALYGRAVLARLAHAAGLSSELGSKRDQLFAEARTEAGLLLQQSPTAVLAEELRDAKPPAEPEPAAPASE